MGLHREDVFNKLKIERIRGSRFRPVLGTLTLSVQFCNQNLPNSAKVFCCKHSNDFHFNAFTILYGISKKKFYLLFERNISVRKSYITVTTKKIRPDLNKFPNKIGPFTLFFFNSFAVTVTKY